MMWRRQHRDDRQFLPSDDLNRARFRAHRKHRLSDPIALAVILVVAAAVAGIFWAGGW